MSDDTDKIAHGPGDPIAVVIRRLASPLKPLPTGETPVLTSLDGIRAVLFDVYGTLFISGSGDIDAVASRDRVTAFSDAAALCGLINPPDAVATVTHLDWFIRGRHEASLRDGITCPEIDILDVWRDVFDDLTGDVPDDAALRRFAATYESLVNPVWPMPGCRETLEELRDAGLPLGLVSNSQFCTMPMFEGLLDRTPATLGIQDDLVVLSYRLGQAKPGRAIYEAAATALAARNITANETLFVGNDLLNDVTAAAAVGFRTILFAGDARSLRKREGDDRLAGVKPDSVITDLRQLMDILNALVARIANP